LAARNNVQQLHGKYGMLEVHIHRIMQSNIKKCNVTDMMSQLANQANCTREFLPWLNEVEQISNNIMTTKISTNQRKDLDRKDIWMLWQ
jgi:hypothetical protein